MWNGKSFTVAAQLKVQAQNEVGSLTGTEGNKVVCELFLPYPQLPPPWSIPQMRYHVPWLPYPTMPSVSTRRLRSWLKPWTPDDLFNPFSWKVCAVVVFFFAAVVAQGDGVGRSGTPVTCLSEALIEFPLVPEGHTLCNIQVERQENRERYKLWVLFWYSDNRG